FWINAFFKELNIEGKEKEGKVLDVIKYIEMPVADVIAKMENRGIMIGDEVIKQLELLLKTEIEKVKKEIFTEIGHEFNLNSPKQLSDVLYQELHLPTVLTGKNKWSTKEEVLLELIPHHPSIEGLLKYRELSKLLTTYIVPLADIASKNKGVVRTDFRQAGASSGRFSSVNPNLQNIPARGDWGNEVRKIFVAREGFKFVGADYSQIEFRVMADISEDPELIKEFAENVDIHIATASHVFKKELSEVTKEERGAGKTINFAILFGQTPYGLSKMLRIDQKIAKSYIDEYFKHYAGVAKYIENSKEAAYKDGYVQSMLGRTRYINGVFSKNRNLKEAAMREAINMPIQGGEADIVRLAMIKLDKLMNEKYKDKAFMLLQIHDELVFEVKESEVEGFKKDVYEVMKNVIQLKVPLDVHISEGNNLSDLK
ncbi:MAG TPA: DNA polymerase, partial [Candidatus Dojkabacteria bacterium]|nr:DNA polymerase [Candidatus Dojkabacteria bacterium]